MTTNLPAFLFLIPFLTAILMPALGAFRPRACWSMTLVALSAFALIAVRGLVTTFYEGPIRYRLSGWAPPLGIEWHLDGLSSMVIMLIAGASLVGVVYAGPEVERQFSKKIVPFYTLVMLLISALTGIVLTADLFNLFVFFEVASLSAYALVAVAGNRALLASFRYLILGTIGASFYLLGVGYLYAETGTLNMADLASQLPNLLESKAALSGLVFIFIGLGIKTALMPLHGWLPDAYAYAPEAVTPLLASLMTKVALYAFARVTFWVLGPEIVWSEIPIMSYLGWVGGFAMLVGAFLALSEQNIKRMFAFGGLSHIGLVVLGLSLGNQQGYTGGIYYLLIDAVMQLSLFMVAGTLVFNHGIRKISELKRIGRGMPWTTAALVITALSMIGIPPTGGFFGKLIIIMGAIEAGNFMAVGVIILATIITLVYFVRLVEKILFERKEPSGPLSFEPPSSRIAMGVVTASILLFGIFSDPVVIWIESLASPGF